MTTSEAPQSAPTPQDLSHRWAAVAAVQAASAAASGREGAWCRDGLRFLHDFGGSWCALAMLPEDRALLFLWDRGAESADLTAGAPVVMDGRPAWWLEGLQHPSLPQECDAIDAAQDWADGIWTHDAFDPDEDAQWDFVPVMCDEDAVLELMDWVEAEAEDHGLTPPDRPTIAAIVAAGPTVSAEQLAAVGFPHWDVAEGVAAARAFIHEPTG